MTADVELLPLLDDGPYYDPGDMQEYARACVAHATAAKDAEIEALLEQVSRFDEMHVELGRQLVAHEEQAERLSEALRHLRNHTSVNSHQIELIDAALNPTAAQEGEW